MKGIVHVTGGGFDGNVPRVLPQGVRARIDLGSWPRPPIFDWLQQHGEIAETEMLRVFNCGIGMVLVVAPDQSDDVLERLQGLGERAYESARSSDARPRKRRSATSACGAARVHERRSPATRCASAGPPDGR